MKKILSFIIMVLFIHLAMNAQEVRKPSKEPIFEQVEQPPIFPGGESAMKAYLAANIQYPQEALEKKIEGRVVVGVVVKKDGLITNVHVIRSIDPQLDNEAVRIVKSMSRWIPGKQNGHFVQVKHFIPVSFKLKNNSSNEAVFEFETVEQPPMFPGGENAMLSYLISKIRYPQDASEKKIEGRVLVSFIVEEDGSITNAYAIHSVDPQLDHESVRLIKSMPKWIPGKHNGQNVRVRHQLPINFKIQQ